MENWREMLIREAEQTRDLAIKRFEREASENITNATFACVVKRKIIEGLREKPDMIFGDKQVIIRTDSHLTVHDVSKSLRVKLTRHAEHDGFEFRTEFNKMTVLVYGVKNVPRCRIVPHKKRVTVTTYEAMCNSDADAFTNGTIKRIV